MPGLLALLAHPDDEYFCGGLLAALRENGIPVHLAYWTRGEGGGSPRFRRFWGSLPGAWHPRTREAKRVAALLRAQSLHFLGGIDPAPNPNLCAPDQPTPVAMSNIEAIITRQAPEMIVTHGSEGDYGHPAHIRLHKIAREVCAAQPALGLITFNAAGLGAPGSNFINASDPADFVFDAQPFAEDKRNIVRVHRSQKGALETISGTGGTLDALIAATRYEGYRCWGDKACALRRLESWTSPSPR